QRGAAPRRRWRRACRRLRDQRPRPQAWCRHLRRAGRQAQVRARDAGGVMSRRRLLLAAAFAWLAIVIAPAAHALSAPEQARIERLIKYVESRTDLQFVRNGSSYSSEDAAKFLRGKLDGMGGNVNTAQQFIEQIATRSSSSG